jgi:hypothetical protein
VSAPRAPKRQDPLTWATCGLELPETVGSRVPVELHAKQLEFLALPHLEAMYGGAAGGGKTEALLADALQYVHEPRYKALVLRRTYPELAKPGAIMDRALTWLGYDLWNDRDKRFRFPSGAVLQFGYCNSEGHLAQYKSAEFHRIYIDEITEWPEKWVLFFFSRLRRTLGDPIPIGLRSATNPNGLGAEWVRARYGIPEGAIVRDPIENRREDRIFLPATADDNPHLDLKAYNFALSRLPASLYKQLRFGQWVRDGEGLVYASFDTLRNVLTAADPRAAEHFLASLDHFVLGIDFGFVDATAFAILGWRDEDPTVYVVSAWKETKLIPSAAAQIIHDLEEERRFDAIVGDVSGLGKGYAEEAKTRWHVPIEPAQKNNKRGYIKLLNGELEEGRLRILSPWCDELKKEWTELPWHDKKRDKEAEGFENHLADAVLYGWRAATAFRELPPKPKTQAGTVEREEERVAAWREERRRAGERGAAGRAAGTPGGSALERWQPGRGGTARWKGRGA